MARILIVDDDEHFRTMLRMTLTRAGYEVLEAEDGDAALEVFHTKGPDLVITDIVMPGKEGLEFIMELHKEFPSTHIIAISGGGRANPYSYLSMAKNLGAESVFVKPLDREALLARVRELVDGPVPSEEQAP